MNIKNLRWEKWIQKYKEMRVLLYTKYLMKTNLKKLQNQYCVKYTWKSGSCLQ